MELFSISRGKGAAKGKDIKILYGVEGYLVEDSEDIIQDANDKELFTNICSI